MTCVGDWVVALVGRDLDSIAIGACEYIVGSVALVIDVLGAHQSPYSAILIVLGQLVAIISLIILLVQQVISGTSMVLLSGIELILLDL